MNRKVYLILGLVVYTALVVWLSLRTALPKKEEIIVEPAVRIVSEKIFEDPAVARVKTFSQFGQLPVTVDKGFLGRDNPFVP